MNIEQIRKDLNMSIDEFVDNLSISKQTYKKWVKEEASPNNINKEKIGNLIKCKDDLKKEVLTLDTNKSKGMQLIDKKREVMGISVTDLISKADISRDMYYKCLRGERKPSLEILNKICKIVGIDIKEIVQEFI